MSEYIFGIYEALANKETGEVCIKPTVNGKLIRCKDCKWKQGSECTRFADVRPFPDDYCSRGERKEVKDEQ